MPQVSFTDHLGRELSVPAMPKKVVSLCPSQTSTLVELGLGARLAGRTQFCIHPMPDISAILIVGGTKNLRMEVIEALAPDLVIAEKEENTQEMVEVLSQRCPVFVTDVRDIPSGLRMITDLGSLTGLDAAAKVLRDNVESALASVTPLPRAVPVLYFIWRKPWMLVGADTYIDSVMSLMGFQNIAAGLPGRYPELPEDLSSLEPEFLLLSSEPFPFKEKHCAEIEGMFPKAKAILVDGEVFSWYGEKMRELPAYTAHLRTLLKRGQ